MKKILVDGKIIENRDIFLKEKFGFEDIGIIRIPGDEYKNIKNKKYITHFNLGQSKHRKNKIYILPKILENGFKKDGKIKQPNLSLKNIFIARCIEVKENIKYSRLKKDDFLYSFDNIKNTEELKKIILKRYKISRPEMTEKEILKQGVSQTKLEIL